MIKEIADASVADAQAALDAACEAFPTWAATPARERAELLRRAFDLCTAHADDFALLMTLEMGKPLAEARGEVTYGGGVPALVQRGGAADRRAATSRTPRARAA